MWIVLKTKCSKFVLFSLPITRPWAKSIRNYRGGRSLPTSPSLSPPENLSQSSALIDPRISRKPKVDDKMLLNCLVHGEVPAADRIFTVEISKVKPVTLLKKAIKKEKRIFRNIDADQLSLWKVSIPIDSSMDEELRHLSLEDDVTNGIQKLFPVKKLSSYFSDSPTDEHLHIIVESPLAIFLTSLFQLALQKKLMAILVIKFLDRIEHFYSLYIDKQ